jgi:hypothetical protein
MEPFPLGCDSVAPSAEGLVSGERLEQLYCSVSAHNPEITFEGDVWCTFADDHHGPLSGPDWIDQRGYCELRTEVGSRWLYGQPVMRLLDEARNPVEGRYTITGHFDDPGAADCRASGMEGSVPPPAVAVVLSCRTAFVVTEASPASRSRLAPSPHDSYGVSSICDENADGHCGVRQCAPGRPLRVCGVPARLA